MLFSAFLRLFHYSACIQISHSRKSVLHGISQETYNIEIQKYLP
nr:MAG TPA: hypothetical protein [Caudoviricetes sp.]